MNQSRSQRYTAVLLALLGLFLGSNVGFLFDQAAGLSFDAALWPAFTACGYCVQAGVPLVARVVSVNRWTLLGALAGLVVGLLVAGAMRLRRAQPLSQPKRLSSLRQAAELARFSRALSDTLELPSILTRLQEEVIQVTGADCGSTFLLDPASPEHRVALRVGEGAGLQRLSPMEAAAVASGRSRIIHDFEAEGEAPPHVGVQSALLVPITHEGNAIGLIHLHSQQSAAFDTEFHDFVEVLAAQAAVAIQNAQRYDEQARRSENLRQRVNQLQQLSQIPNTVRIDRPLTGNLQAIAQTMQETANFSLVLISVFVPAGNQLVHTAAAGLPAETFDGLKQLPLPWERLQPFLREENRSNRVYRVSQSQTGDLYQALDLGRPKKLAEPSAPGQWQPDDMLLVPLYGSRGEIEGLLSVGAPRDKQTPPSLVLEMLEVFASQSALAIENAQLLAQAEERVTESQERAVQLSALTEAAGAIAAALRVDDVVSLTLEHLRRVIPHDTVTFWQRDLSDGRWKLLGARSYIDTIERVVARIEQSQAAVFSEISATRSVVFVPDVSRDARFAAKEASSMRSWLGIPMLSSGDVAGILSLEKAEDNFYGPAQVPLALSFANRVAAALENARQFEESVLRAQELETENARRVRDIDARSQRLAVLNRLAAGLSEARELDGLLALVLKTLSEALGAGQARGVIIDPDSPREAARVLATLRLPAGESDPGAAALNLADDPLLQQLQEGGGPLLLEAADRAAATEPLAEPLDWVAPGLTGVLLLPLLAEGRLAGILGLGVAAGRKFTTAEGDLGWAVAQQTVTTLQYLRVRDRTQEQAIVQQLSRAIGRAGTYAELYDVTRAMLVDMAGLKNFSLALYDAARNRVTFPLVVSAGQPAAVSAEPEGRLPSPMISHVLQARQGLRLEGDVSAQAKAAGFALAGSGQHPVHGGEGTPIEPARAYLAEPLLVGERTIGALVAEDPDQPAAFDERAERILAASASQIALAIDNLRLVEQARQTLAATQERASEFETLTQAAAALAAHLRSDEVIAAAVQHLHRIFAFDRVSVWLREAGGQGEWQLAAETGVARNEAAGSASSIDPRSPLNDVLASRHAIVVADTNLESRMATGAAGAWMGVPLISHGAVIGLAQLERDQPGGFSPQQVPLAEALATRITLALDNARQYEASLRERQSVEAEARRLELLNRAARDLGGMLDLSDVLAASLSLLTKALDLERAGLVVYDNARPVVLSAASLPASAAGAGWPAGPLTDHPLLARLRDAHAPLTLEELANDWPPAREHTAWIGGGVSTAVLLPLSFNGEDVGLAGVGQAGTNRTLTPVDIALAQDLGRLISAALYEARQHAALQQRLVDQDDLNQQAQTEWDERFAEMQQRLLTQMAAIKERLHDYERRGALLASAANQLAGTRDLQGTLALGTRLLAEALEAELGEGLLHVAPGAEAEPAEPEHALAWARYPADAAASAPAAIESALIEQLRDARGPLALPDGTGAQAAGLGARVASAVLFPLRAGERQLGLIVLGFPAGRTVTPAALDVGQQLANQVAAAISSALLYAELQERLNEQSTIDQAIRATSRAGDLQQLLEIISARLNAWVAADNFMLALFDEERNEASLPLLMEAGQPRTVEPFTPGGLLRHILQTRRPLRLGGDIATQAREMGVPLAGGDQRPARWASEGGEVLAAQAYLGVPILFGDQVLGVLAVEANRGPRAFDERQERILLAVASQIALVLDNTRLYLQTTQALAAAQDRVAQLEALAAALSVIAGALYSEDVVDLALDQFQRVIAYDRAVFWRRETGGVGREVRWRAVGARGYLDAEDPLRNPLALEPGQAVLFAEMASNHRIVYLADLSRDSRFQPADAAPTAPRLMRAWLGVPLVNKGEIIGLLTAEKVEPGYYHAGQVATAQILANQITAVLANTRQYEASVQRVLELDEQSRRLAFLNRFGAELTASLDLDSILQLSLKALAESLGAEQATAAIFDESRSAVLAMAHYPAELGAQSLPGLAALPGNSIIERMQEIPSPITVEDMTAPETPARLRQAEWIGQEVKAAMFLPLVASGKLMGLIGLGQAAAGRRFTPAEMDLGMALANQAATAAQNARLYDRTQQRLAEQANINQLGRALGRSLDLRSLAASLRDQMEAWVGANDLILAVVDPGGSTVSFPLAILNGQPMPIEPQEPSGLVRYLLQRSEPLLLNGDIGQQLKDLGVYGTGLESADARSAADWGSTLAVPLAAGDQMVGALILAGPRRAERFDETHERILVSVASQLTTALGLAQQFEQSRQAAAVIQNRATQLGLLSDASATIASALRSEQVRELILVQAQRILPYDGASLWQRSQANDRWWPVASRGQNSEPAAQSTAADPAPNQSPVGEVLATRASLVISEAAADTRFAGRAGRPGAWLGVPLIHQGNLMAVLALEKAEPNAFTAAQIPLAEAFAQQAAVALANVRRYEDSVQRAFELDERSALLNRVAAALSQTMDPVEVLAATLTALGEALGITSGAALLFDESRSTSRVRATARYPAGAEESANPLPLTGNLLVNQLRDRLAPVAAADLAADSLVKPEYGEWIGPDISSALFLPLAVAGELLGLIAIGHGGKRQPFMAGEIEFAMTLANQAALAAHNARQYQQTQRRLTELATIGQASRAISQTVDLKQVFDTVRTHIEVSLRADSYYLALYDEGHNEVSFPLAVERGETLELSSRAPDAFIRQVLTTGQPLLTGADAVSPLTEASPAPSERTAADASPALRARSYLGVPLLLGNKVTGVLAVADYQRSYAFTEKHERSLAAIAAPIAAAVDGARLFEQSARRARALDARAALLGQLSAQLSESSSLTHILQIAAQAIAETLMVEVGGAFVLDETPGAVLPLAHARYPEVPDDHAPAFSTGGSAIAGLLQAGLAPIAMAELPAESPARVELANWLSDAIKSALLLPLITADRLIGVVVAAQVARERDFTPSEIDLAMSLANQAAVAVTNAYLQEKMQPRLVELAAISRICNAISRPANLSQLWDTLRVEIGAVLEARTLILALYDPTSQAMSFPIILDSGQALTASPRAPSGALAYILQQRAPLLLNGDVEAQLAQLGGEYRALLAGARTPQSYLGVPLMLGGQVIGVVVVEDEHVGKFTQSQAFILKTIAAPIAVAIDNARLQVERQARAVELLERARQLALLSQLSAGLIGDLEPDASLRLMLDELQAVVPLDYAAGFLLGPENGASPAALLAPVPPEAAHPDAQALEALLTSLKQAHGAPIAPDSSDASLAQSDLLAWLGIESSARLVVPLMLAGRLMGFVALARGRSGQGFSSAEIELALTASNQAALAIDRAHLAAAARQAGAAAEAQAAQFGQLAAAAGAIAPALTTAQVLAAISEQLSRALPYDSLKIFEIEADASGRAARLHLLAGRGSAEPSGTTIELPSNPLLSELANSPAPMQVADIQAGPRSAAGDDTAQRPAPGSWLALPLTSAGRTSHLILAQKRAPGFYGAGHLALARALAGPLAAALENARELDAARQWAGTLETETQRLTLLNESAGAVFGAVALPDILRQALAAMQRASGGEQASALLFADAKAGQASPIFIQQPGGGAESPPSIDDNPLLERFKQPETRGALVFADTTRERIQANHAAWIGGEVRSAIVLPLMIDDAWVGVIGIGHSHSNALLPESLAILTDIAQQLAVAVKIGRGHLQLSSAVREQYALANFSQSISQADNIGQIREAANAVLGSLFEQNTWYLALIAPGTNLLTFAPLMEAGRLRQIPPLAPEGVIKHILTTRRPLLLSGDISSQLKDLSLPHRGSRARRESGDPSPAKAYLGVPLLAEGQALGVLAIEDAQHAAAFNDESIQRLTTVAAQLTAAVQRVYALGQLQDTTRQVNELRGQVEQDRQAAQAAQAELADRSASLRDTEARYEQAARDARLLELWRAQVAQLLKNAENQAATATFEPQLSSALLIGCRALEADAAAIYLPATETGSLAMRTSHGLAQPLLAALARDDGLAQAAFAARQPLLIADLAKDPRWAVEAEGPGAAGAETLGAGSNGTHGNGSNSPLPAAEGAAPEAGLTAPASNGTYHSALALPLLAGAQTIGVVVFLSTRPQAFNEASLPVGAAVASQVTAGVQAAAQAEALRWQTQALRELAQAPAPAQQPPAAETTVVAVPRPPVRQLPTPPILPPLPAAEPPVQAAPVPAAAASVAARPAAWRRLAVPVGIVAVVLCLAAAAALNAAPLQQALSGIFGGSASTPTPFIAATSTLPGALTTPQSNAPTASSSAPTQTHASPPTATATPGRPTATPLPTDTPLPSPTPTVPLPPDVVAAATVNLAPDIVGRLRDGPNGTVIGGVKGGSTVHVLRGRETTSDGIVWVEIRLPDTGQTGWFAENLLKYAAP